MANLILTSILTIVLILGSAASAAADSHCPENRLHCSTAFGPMETISTKSASYWLDCPDRYPGSYFSTVSYDLAAARFEVATGGGDSQSGNWMYVSDSYTLVAPDASGPITFEARLELDGYVSASSGFAASLRSGTAFDSLSVYASSSEGPSWITVDTDLVIPVTAEPGSKFDVGVYLRSSAGWVQTYGRLNVIGVLNFGQLPPGFSIRSCQGFTQEAPIPVVARSWSLIKARFSSRE
jgi:hypothetical protein